MMYRWIDQETAATTAGVTRRTIYRWIQSGEITTRNKGREICLISLERVKADRLCGHLLRKYAPAQE